MIPGLNWLPTTTIEAPGVPGRRVVNGLSGHKAGQTSASKAKAMLKKAGKLGFTLSWLYEKDAKWSVADTKVLTKAFTAAGFKTKPVATTSAKYYSALDNPKTAVNLRLGYWFADWPSGYSWIPTLFSPPNPGKSCAKQGTWKYFGVANYAHFCSDSVNAKIKSIMTMPLAQQPTAWSSLEKTIQTTYYPVIPLDNRGVLEPFGAGLGGVDIDSGSGMPTFKTIWVKQ